jgi:hypothetical protein
MDTIDLLWDERGEDDDIWGSMVKQALKRRQPGFNESYYGFRGFNELLRPWRRTASSSSSPTSARAGTSSATSGRPTRQLFPAPRYYPGIPPGGYFPATKGLQWLPYNKLWYHQSSF